MICPHCRKEFDDKLVELINVAINRIAWIGNNSGSWGCRRVKQMLIDECNKVKWLNEQYEQKLRALDGEKEETTVL